jgi:hypothetical protein
MPKFARRDNVFSLIFRALFFTLPFNIFGVEIEIGLVSIFAPGILVGVVIFSALLGLAFKQHLVGPPLVCWLPLVLLTIGGILAGTQTKQALLELLGFEPKTLFVPGTEKQVEVLRKRRGKWRYLNYLLFSFVVASFLSWYWFVYPRDRFEMAVRGDIAPFLSFIRVWVQYIFPYWFNAWSIVLRYTFAIVIAADILPFTREILRRTRSVEIASVVILVIFNIWMVVWWYSIYQPSF